MKATMETKASREAPAGSMAVVVFSRQRSTGFVALAMMLVAFRTSSALEIHAVTPTVVRGTFVSTSSADQLALQPYFDSSGMLSISGNTASGTLIRENWVLTAAHVISSSPGRHDLSSATFSLGGQPYVVSYAEVHPNWNGDVSSGFDLALVRLTSAISNVAPAPFGEGPPNLIGLESTFVGFGLGGVGETGAVGGTGGVKRAGTNRLDYDGSLLGFSSSIFLADFDSGSASHSSLGSSTPTSFESITSPGDSGGGVFVNVNGQMLLVGVNSFVASLAGETNSSYGEIAGFQSLQPHLAWVQGIAHAPEPASLILGVICALAGWWVVDRKSRIEGAKKPTKRAGQKF